MLAVMIWRLARLRAAARSLGVAACLLLTALVASSRVWLGVHYPSDVVGGTVLGLSCVALSWTIREGWGRYRTRDVAAA
jgi:undecaprenyl-diphosphatase